MVKLCKLWGINVFLHWSLGILAVLLLPPLYSFNHLGPVLNAVLALVMTVGFIGSVLAHELAHSLVAKRCDVSIHRIVLFVFGGAAQMSSSIQRPKDELWIALAGPFMSIALGVLGFIAYGLTGSNVASFLGITNLMLGVWNLLPFLPSDGGRVLRALLWWGTGDFLKATLIAAWVSKAFVGLFVFCGVMMVFGYNIPLLGTGVFNGVWMVLISLLINRMLDAEVERARG